MSELSESLHKIILENSPHSTVLKRAEAEHFPWRICKGKICHLVFIQFQECSGALIILGYFKCLICEQRYKEDDISFTSCEEVGILGKKGSIWKY